MLFLLLGACIGREDNVWGDEGRVRFSLDVSYNTSMYSEAWIPEIPLALQTTATISAIGWKDSSGYTQDHGPQATASWEGDVLTVLHAEPDHLEIRATQPGITSVAWDGDAQDTLSVAVAAPAAVQLLDPALVAARIALAGDGELLHGELPSDLAVSDVLVLSEGVPICLWLTLLDDGFRPLAFNEDSLIVATEGGAMGAASLNELVVQASTLGTLAFEYAGQPLPPIPVDEAALDAVASVSLLVIDPGSFGDSADFDLVVGAVARDSAGRRIHQPHTVWTLPSGFDEVSPYAALLGAAYDRTDVRFLRWTGAEEPVSEVELGVTVGEEGATAVVPFTPSDPPPPENRVGAGGSSSGCCGAGGAGYALLALAPFLRRRKG